MFYTLNLLQKDSGLLLCVQEAKLHPPLQDAGPDLTRAQTVREHLKE